MEKKSLFLVSKRESNYWKTYKERYDLSMKYQLNRQESQTEVPAILSNEILKDLNPAQREAAAHKEGPCIVLAGPGSGKTFTIAKRIEYLIRVQGVDPGKILVITFTKYAANEMKQRFRKVCGDAASGVTCGTFHGIYYGILKWACGYSAENILGEEEKYAILRSACEEGLDQEELKDLAEEIGNIKNNGLRIEDYVSLKNGEEKFREIYNFYEAQKAKLHKIDFEDMLILCKKLFLERPDILKKWQEKFTYILVDEFQDVNQIQYDVIRMLAKPEDNLFIVGDDDQSIYGFRGAKPGIMRAFKTDYPAAKQVLLNINYRSDAYVVKGALRVIAHNKDRFGKAIEANQKAANVVHVQETLNPMEESKYLLGKIQERMKAKVALKDMAVLYRTASDARVLSEVLSEYQVPFTMRDQVKNIYDHFIATDIKSYFSLSQGDYQRKFFLQIANRPNRYIGRDALSENPLTYEKIRNFYCDKHWMMDRLDQLEWDMKMIKDKTPYAAIQYIRKSIGYDDFLRDYADYRGLELSELKEVLEEIQEFSKECKTISEWFEHVENYTLELQKQKSKSEKKEGINLLTMHTAKGLEFDTVFVISCHEGCIPYKKAKLESEIEEERRLFYVAMTRAKQKLILSYTKEKGGKDVSPSRFLKELLVI